MFIDRVNVKLSAGRGGDGAVAWIRLKYIPKGGPCGGNGGKGGSVILRTNVNTPSLEWFRNRKILKAKNGQPGGPNCCTGKGGENLILDVPCGTLVKDVETGEVLYDLVEEGQEVIICQGGKGGRGNDSFKSPTNRAPNQYTPGTPGEEREVELELKLIADVGLIGFPNAGKSTLITSLCDVKVKVAPYPFTTLVPNIGYILNKDMSRVFVADIPGIIEGAHRNRGLGLEFLRHIERTRLLLFVLDASGIDGRDPASDFKVLKKELEAYSPELAKRPYLVALNKIDDDESIAHLAKFEKEFPEEKVFFISALTKEGLEELTAAINQKL
ncbi:MAG: GTPase ObgE [Chlamydiia bacterium]|nr:GTPase ObgE [Chlamydiia bacterium]